MGKVTFQLNYDPKTIKRAKGIVASKLYDLSTGKFCQDDIIALLEGDQIIDSYEGFEYVTHEVLVWNSNGVPQTVELLAKSNHSFAHYGACREQLDDGTWKTVPAPVCDCRKSLNGHSVPDFEMENVVSPFRFKVVSAGVDPISGQRLSNARVEHLQFARVVGFKYYWTAVYDATNDVKITKDTEKCVFKRMRKPIFEIITDIPRQYLNDVEDYLKNP